MSAEGNLYNPLIFSPINFEQGREYGKLLPERMRVALIACDVELVDSAVDCTTTNAKEGPAYAPATYLASQYLAIVLTLPSTETSSSAIKSHLFKLFRPIWATGRHLDTREKMGNLGGPRDLPNGAIGAEEARGEKLRRWFELVEEIREKIKVGSLYRCW